MMNFKPAGCEEKNFSKTYLNYAAAEYDDDEDDDFYDDDGFYFNDGETKNKPKHTEPVFNLIEKKSERLCQDENNTPQIQMLFNKKESDLVIDFKQAIINHNFEKVKSMLSNGTEISINFVFNNGWSPLMYAVASGCYELIEYFIANDIDVNHTAGIFVTQNLIKFNFKISLF